MLYDRYIGPMPDKDPKKSKGKAAKLLAQRLPNLRNRRTRNRRTQLTRRRNRKLLNRNSNSRLVLIDACSIRQTRASATCLPASRTLRCDISAAGGP